MLLLIRRHRTMILVSIFFFYLGCGITLSFLRIECADAINYDNAQSSVNSKVDYAVLVLSGPDNEDKRDTIRATWAHFAGNIHIENGEKIYKWNHSWVGKRVKQDFIKIYFVIGTRGLNKKTLDNLKEESLRTNDLLLFDFEDSYKNLAIKVLHSMKWFSTHLRNLKYLVKCDDDSFLRIDLIIKDLEAYAPKMNGARLQDFITHKFTLPSYKGLYWGYFDGRARGFTKGKWQESSWFLCDTYLPYALGGGYVVSRSIVDYIANNIDMLSVYNSEDVSMGVWTAALDGINRVHDIRFDTEWKSRGCLKEMLVRHKQSPNDMFHMYSSLVQSHGKILCKTEVIHRKSYLYNWNQVPSKCCQ